MKKQNKTNENWKKKLSKYPPMYSLSECRNILPKVYNLTYKYYDRVKKLKDEIKKCENFIEKKYLEELINKNIQRWARIINRNNLKIDGLWCVDFDSGDGIYYCWKFPEKGILYFHSYETSTEGRRPISLLEGQYH